MIGSETMVLGLQNGLGNAEKINRVVPEQQILYGLCEVGSDLAGTTCSGATTGSTRRARPGPSARSRNKHREVAWHNRRRE